MIIALLDLVIVKFSYLLQECTFWKDSKFSVFKNSSSEMID